MSPAQGTPVELSQDCDVTLIPSGRTTTLRAGETIVVTQALGGTVTVQTASGQLARISSTDAHTLGVAVEPSDPELSAWGPFEYEQVTEQLKTVFDPEIPVNIVDLGLIYACEAHLQADGSYHLDIKMSMTAPGCGMGDILKHDVRSRVQTLPGVSEVDVELVWDPPWDQSRLTDAARLELGLY
jgi:probable FeS assembly SUF system protein SufT